MRESEITKIIDEVYRRELSDFGYRSVSVAFGVDHLGDPAIFATAQFDDVEEERFPGRLKGPLLLEIFDRLRAEGETRFPYVSHAFPAPAA